MSIPFRERNPVPIGAVGLLVIAVLLYLAFNASNLPIIGGGTAYSAAFSEAGGIKPDDDVRIAGVKVGKVTGVDLENGHVRVDFTITEDASFGPQTGASIRMKTILGEKYVALDPKGQGQLDPDAQIPLARTVSSYDIVNAFQDLTTTTERIDTGQLATSLGVIATEFKDSPTVRQGHPRRPVPPLAHRREPRRGAGLAAPAGQQRQWSRAQPQRAGEHPHQGRRPAHGRAGQAPRRHPHALPQHLGARDAAHRAGPRQPGPAEAGPRRARQDPGPAAEARDDLQKTIDAMAPFTRVYANTLGTGRWFDTWVSNLVVPVGTPGLALPGTKLPNLLLPGTSGGGR